MLRPNRSHMCQRPDLCIVACPYNRILTTVGQWVCEPPELLPGDEEAAVEIVFDDGPKGDDHGDISLANHL